MPFKKSFQKTFPIVFRSVFQVSIESFHIEDDSELKGDLASGVALIIFQTPA